MAPTATNVQTVSLGAIAGCSKADCSDECRAICKALGIDCSTKIVKN